MYHIYQNRHLCTLQEVGYLLFTYYDLEVPSQHQHILAGVTPVSTVKQDRLYFKSKQNYKNCLENKIWELIMFKNTFHCQLS